MSILRIMLGNFPPQSRAHLMAQITHKLEIDDQSYCFDLPMSFIPPYIGDGTSQVVNGVNIVGEGKTSEALVSLNQKQQAQDLHELITMPIGKKSDVRWDISVTITGQEELSRLTSTNHLVDINLSSDKKTALVTLQEQDKRSVPHRDFVLHFRD